MIWLTVLVASAGCYLLKLSGLSLPPSMLGRPAVARAAALIPVALLAALVVVQSFGESGRLVVDARAVGLIVAAIAVIVRAPFLVVLALAAGATAAVRLL